MNESFLHMNVRQDISDKIYVEIYSVKLFHLKEKVTLCCMSDTNIILLTMISTIKRAKFQHPSTVIGKFALFGHAIYSSADPTC